MKVKIIVLIVVVFIAGFLVGEMNQQRQSEKVLSEIKLKVNDLKLRIALDYYKIESLKKMIQLKEK